MTRAAAIRVQEGSGRVGWKAYNDIEARHDDLEQYTRKFNLVIHGVPEVGEEDIKRSECCYSRKTSASEFNTRGHRMHRMNTKSKDKPRPIIARFSNYNAKSKLYKARLNRFEMLT